MSRYQSKTPFDPIRAVKKLFLSGIVLVMFAVYVAYERLIKPELALAASGAPNATAAAPLASGPTAIPNIPFTGGATQPVAPTNAPTTTGYKNGTYDGQAVDAYYGMVQVEVTIQNGSIRNVTFLQYPSDRRTSQMINSQAMPWLTQEAIQAQSANVDIISGATLTSEGFQMSLQSALQAARNGS
jgi:uncharacterized protein with FMN-binding domain